MNKWISAGLLLIARLNRGDTLVVPSQYASVDAPGSGLLFSGVLPGRKDAYQEVFDASSFLNIPSGGILITGFSWRFDNPGQGGGNGGSTTLGSVEVLASTTSRTSSSLSPVLGDNIGSDESLVRAAAPLQITASFPQNKPSPFSINFLFDHPFSYDSSKGNLLLEIHAVNGAGGVPNLDFSSPDGRQGVGFVVEGPIFPVGFYGPVTQFSYQAIPEPSALSLLAAAFGVLYFRRQRL